MKKLSIFPLLITLCLTGCGKEEKPQDPPKPKPNYVDIFLFSGQSNMSGVGEAADALPVTEGHGFEYLAVSGNEETGFLKTAAEPFGRTENNAAINDNSNKVGGMVSSFMEGYYKMTGVPVIGVSASRAGTSINKWKVGTTYHTEAIRRLKSCVDYVTDYTKYKIRNISMLWCQGCSDASEYYNGTFSNYFTVFDEMFYDFKALEQKYSVKKCYVVLPSEYTDGVRMDTKKKIADDYIKFCEENPASYYLASIKFRNVPKNMRKDPHFHQGIYNVAGYDAGSRVGAKVAGKTYEDYKEFILGEDVLLADRYGIDLKYKSVK